MNILNYAGLLIMMFTVNQLEDTQILQGESLHRDARSRISLNNQITINDSIKKMMEHSSREVEGTRELLCLALNIYFEARGESEKGQHAVGHVVINRVSNPKFPNSVCKVVHQGGEQHLNRCQFSWWCDGQSDTPRNVASWHNSVRIARKIYLGSSSDPTGGALWYHADYVSPYWQTAFLRGPKIGKHIFYKDNRRV